MENLNFNELNLSTAMKKAIDSMGFEEATPIQSLAIPHALEGKDVIGQAQTGTGKTCAFGIPAVEMIDTKASGVQVLILCPTRELAIQVAEEIRNLCKFKKGIRSLAIYGGQSIDRQIISLKSKPQIVIGTPGRVMDHMRRHTLKFHNLKMLVLDEADEMLNMGFRDDIDTILTDVPEERQTMLFSATMPKGILEITNLYMKNPEHVVTAKKEVTIDTVEQYYIEVRENSKLELLCRLMDARNIKLGIVFCNTKWKTDELCNHLQARGYAAEALHGDMKQRERDIVMKKFRNGKLELLIATDVAARGIDVSNVEAVFNYDIPSDSEYYVHRIGRTGRAGKKGISFSFVFGRDIYKLKDIERYTKSRINRTKPPTVSSIEASRIQTAIDQVQTAIAKNDYGKYTEVIERILDETDDVTTLDIAAALFKMNFSELDERSYEISELDNDFTINKRGGFGNFLKDKRGIAAQASDGRRNRRGDSGKRQGEGRKGRDENRKKTGERRSNAGIPGKEPSRNNSRARHDKYGDKAVKRNKKAY